MGNCVGSEEDKQNKTFAKKLRAEQKKTTQKLLLLGAGEAGKSTIFKQVKFINHGYDAATAIHYKEPVHANVLEGIKQLIYQARARKTPFSNQGIKYAEEVMNLGLNQPVTKDMATKITYLWTKEKGIQEVYEDQSWGYLSDSTKYMLDIVLRVAEPNYVPSEVDIVHCRVRTSGIEELKFKINEVEFQVMDVGGQQNERKKWIYAFDEVVAVLFVAAISEYDKNMTEDPDKNRLLDAIELFEQICNLDSFRKTAMVLFLNKSDLFEDKFERQIGDMQEIFPDYEGGFNYDEGVNFVISQFLAVQDQDNCSNDTGQPGQEIYFHVTNALNKDNIKVVFEAVQDIVLKINVARSF